eukprot:13340353-Alexandrium_andersonii.AAC.1
MGLDTPTTCKTEQGVWGTPDTSCDATTTTEDTQDSPGLRGASQHTCRRARAGSDRSGATEP